MKIILKDVLQWAFTLLEEENAIQYTKKYNREYLIEGLSQTDILPNWKWFGFNDKNSLSRQLGRVIKCKPNNVKWINYFMYLTDNKVCSICKQIKEREYFCKNKNMWDSLHYTCKECDGKEHKKYREENKEKIKESSLKAYKKKKKEDPTYYKRKNALARKRLKERIPNWVNEEELWMIQCFYADCPEGYHVDHIIPLNGVIVSGLHILSNLQYLSAHDNAVKHNKFEII